MNKEERNTFRKEMLGKLEEQWAKNNRPEDDLFYYHPSEDKIVLSHALFWVMTQNIKGKVGKEKYLLLLRQYQEEMLEAYLTESEDFKDLLHYCNIMYNALPMLLRSTYDFHIHLDARKLAAITIVAGGYGGEKGGQRRHPLATGRGCRQQQEHTAGEDGRQEPQRHHPVGAEALSERLPPGRFFALIEHALRLTKAPAAHKHGTEQSLRLRRGGVKFIIQGN